MPMTPPRLAIARIISSDSWRFAGTIARQLEWDAITGPGDMSSKLPEGFFGEVGGVVDDAEVVECFNQCDAVWG